MYYGRMKELGALEEFYSGREGNAACIYGRFGIGKTSLLKEFSRDKKHIYWAIFLRDTDDLMLIRLPVPGKQSFLQGLRGYPPVSFRELIPLWSSFRLFFLA